MTFAIVLAIILTLGVIALSLYHLKGFKFSVSAMARIGLVSALCIVLYNIKLVPFPQGGGCSLLSILPLMLFASIFGIKEAIMSAIVIASLKLITAPPYYPMQIPLDYFGAMLAVAFTPIFGAQSKLRLGAGALLSVSVSTLFSICSGVIFFSEFAPEGMGAWPYATVYNLTGYGVEAALSVIVLLILPLSAIAKVVRKQEVVY